MSKLKSDDLLSTAEELIEGSGTEKRYAGLAIVDYYKTVMDEAAEKNLGGEDITQQGIKNKFVYLKLRMPSLKRWEETINKAKNLRNEITHSDRKKPSEGRMRSLISSAKDFKKEIIKKTKDKELTLTDIDDKFSEKFWNFYAQKLADLTVAIDNIEEHSFSRDLSNEREKFKRWMEPYSEKNSPRIEDVKYLLEIERKIQELEQEYERKEEALKDMAAENQAEQLKERIAVAKHESNE